MQFEKYKIIQYFYRNTTYFSNYSHEFITGDKIHIENCPNFTLIGFVTLNKSVHNRRKIYVLEKQDLNKNMQYL
jgi:hypothetical protein